MIKKINPKTTKSKSKPKRKPREWVVLIDLLDKIVSSQETIEVAHIMNENYKIIKVREVIE